MKMLLKTMRRSEDAEKLEKSSSLTLKYANYASWWTMRGSYQAMIAAAAAAAAAHATDSGHQAVLQWKFQLIAHGLMTCIAVSL